MVSACGATRRSATSIVATGVYRWAIRPIHEVWSLGQFSTLAPQGAVVARDAADLASLRTAEAAEAARRTKALAVAASASAIADAAARTAVAAQLQADASAVPAADAAAHAARVGAWARLQIPARRSGLRPTQEAASKEGPGNAMGVQRGRGVEQVAVGIWDATSRSSSGSLSHVGVGEINGPRELRCARR
jgi:hypothetical protein